MEWQFLLKNRAGYEIEIEEPIGWDKLLLFLKRGDNHGINYEYSIALVYVGTSRKLIMDEYDTYGIQGKMTLIINGLCNDDWEELYRGMLSFGTYNPAFGDTCELSIETEPMTDIISFTSRINQKVNLDTLKDFAGNDLPAYTYLGIKRGINSKAILVQDDAQHRSNITDPYQGDWNDTPASTGYPQLAFFVPTFDTKVSDEIGGFDFPTSGIDAEYDVKIDNITPTPGIALPYEMIVAASNGNTVDLDQINPIINYDKTLGPFHGSLTGVQYNFHIEKLEIVVNTVSGFPVTTGILALGFYMCKKDVNGTVTWISNSQPVWGVYNPSTPATPVTPFITATKTISGTFDLAEGDRVYLFFGLIYAKYDALNTYPAFNITHHNGAYFTAKVLTTYPATSSKIYMANEVFSRIAEAISDNKLRVYSEYFGRTDSKPYTTTSDGCGSMEGLTSGLLLRRMDTRKPDQQPIMALSWEDAWNGFHPIHNLGWGLENDTLRSGYKRIRVEPCKWFYKTGIVFDCKNIDKINVKVRVNKHYSKVTVGYSKWEAEQYNGIDEFFTKREYRTDLSQVNNPLQILSSFIASPYAIEITRRLGFDTSEDWRYDNETFILCFKRLSGSITIESGSVTGASNMIDPNTMLNYRISPARNGLRWLSTILASYKAVTNSSKISFTDGTGNVYAAGELNSSFCKIEDEPISEKADLMPSMLATPASAYPFLELEEITFKYPLSLKEWNTIKQSPYKQISYSTNGLEGVGWIDMIKYSPEQGTAEFTLTPTRQ